MSWGLGDAVMFPSHWSLAARSVASGHLWEGEGEIRYFWVGRFEGFNERWMTKRRGATLREAPNWHQIGVSFDGNLTVDFFVDGVAAGQSIRGSEGIGVLASRRLGGEFAEAEFGALFGFGVIFFGIGEGETFFEFGLSEGFLA